MTIFKRGEWWTVVLLIEGEKEAQIVARKEGLPMPDHNFDQYPVDLELPGKWTKRRANKKLLEYSELNIYGICVKVRKM